MGGGGGGGDQYNYSPLIKIFMLIKLYFIGSDLYHIRLISMHSYLGLGYENTTLKLKFPDFQYMYIH